MSTTVYYHQHPLAKLNAIGNPYDLSRSPVSVAAAMVQVGYNNPPMSLELLMPHVHTMLDDEEKDDLSDETASSGSAASSSKEQLVSEHEEHAPKQTRSQKTERKRRCIFPTYWGRNKAATPSTTTTSSTADSNTHSPAAASESIHHFERGNSIDITEYSPSPDDLTNKHHELLENVFQDSGKIPSTRSLPPLPEPLRRMVSESISSKGCGMYPLVSPKSILRPSRYRAERQEENEEHFYGAFTRSLLSLNGNLTHSFRVFESGMKLSGRPVNDVAGQIMSKKAREMKQCSTEIANSSSSCSHQYEKKSVGFDPRIVITEFADGMEREWYKEHELSILKNETIQLATQYTLLHPDLVRGFVNENEINPVTGEKRKRALFSLPILNSLPEDFSLDTFSKQMHDMMFHGVKRLLIVDPNQVIQQLFRKSLRKLFPDTRIDLASNGEEALSMFQAAIGFKSDSMTKRAYDIILVEENLVTRRDTGGNIEKKEVYTLTRTNSLNMADKPPRRSHRLGVSVSNLETLAEKDEALCEEPVGMTGSQFITKIRELEDAEYAASKERFPRCIFVGVSSNVERDGDVLHESGADMVWTKPPPRMGKHLRNRLLGALIRRRLKRIDVSES